MILQARRFGRQDSIVPGEPHPHPLSSKSTAPQTLYASQRIEQLFFASPLVVLQIAQLHMVPTAQFRETQLGLQQCIVHQLCDDRWTVLAI